METKERKITYKDFSLEEHVRALFHIDPKDRLIIRSHPQNNGGFFDRMKVYTVIVAKAGNERSDTFRITVHDTGERYIIEELKRRPFPKRPKLNIRKDL